MQELIHEETREGFTIRFCREDEDLSPVGNASAIDDETDAAIGESEGSGASRFCRSEATRSATAARIARKKPSSSCCLRLACSEAGAD